MLKTKTTHAEVLLFRPPWQIERWLMDFQYQIEDMIRQWKRKYYRLALDKSSCAAYGGCPYKTLCASPNPDQWILPYYDVQTWDPTAKEPLKESTGC